MSELQQKQIGQQNAGYKVEITGAWKTCQPKWGWDDITPTNLIPTNTGELGLGVPQISDGKLLHSGLNLRWKDFF